ncbi:MAG: hypothetical protein FJ126_13435 [Deltaproteobacteria bacterium]|nr:hypothetical protein [Deltaproteobacteria bacterium]
MKKVIITLTALAFALSLAGPGMAQTVTKEGDKPAVKMEHPGAQPEAAKEVKPVAKEETKPVEVKGKTDVKPGDKDQGKKDDKSKKNDKKVKKDDKKPVTPDKPKEEKK